MMLTRSLKHSLWSFYHIVKQKRRDIGQSKREKGTKKKKKKNKKKTAIITQAMLLGSYNSHVSEPVSMTKMVD